jgi:hypothetical protein
MTDNQALDKIEKGTDLFEHYEQILKIIRDNEDADAETIKIKLMEALKK